MAVFKRQGVYWMDHYVHGVRKRERIGPDKRLAETVLRKRKVEIAEGKSLDKQQPVTTTFDELADAYLKWICPDESAGISARKRSWKSHDLYAIGQLRAYFGGKRLTTITPALVGQYRNARRATISRRKRPVSPATVNRELACLKRMVNVALKGLIVLKGGVPVHNPVANISLEREHNERDRVLSAAEFERLYQAAEAWVKPMLLVAYHTGMRKGEIRSLRWDHIDQGGPHSAEVWRHKDRRRPGNSLESSIDNPVQIQYKIIGLPVGVRQSRAYGCLAGQPCGGGPTLSRHQHNARIGAGKPQGKRDRRHVP